MVVEGWVKVDLPGAAVELTAVDPWLGGACVGDSSSSDELSDDEGCGAVASARCCGVASAGCRAVALACWSISGVK